MYKVFINDRPLIVDYSANLQSSETLRAELQKLELGQLDSAQIQISWARFLREMDVTHTYIEAAGGLVSRADGKLLAIERLGRWDLPKGKIEKGETAWEASKREVEEECGILVSEILEELPSTYHTYTQKGKKCFKRTYWYQMITHQTEGTPQVEEDITRLAWFNADEFNKIMATSYESIADWNAKRTA